MDKLRKKGQGIKLFFKTDWNIVRAKKYGRQSATEIRYGAGRYLSNLFPIVQWISSYNPRWLFGDVLSGMTAGIVLVLQAANLPSSAGAAISTQQTLIASWLPGFIYALTGSSKNISIGPTSSGTLLSLQLVGPLASASRTPPFVVMSALTFCVGIWSLLFGMLGLGFVLDLIPISISLAVVTTIGLNLVIVQVPTFLGLHGIPPIVPAIPPAVIQNITNVSLRTLVISISAITFLAALRQLCQKFGKSKTGAGRVVRAGFNMGGILVVLIFTAVSFLFLRNVSITEQVAPSSAPTMGGAAPVSAPPASALPQERVNTTATGAAQIIIPAKREEPEFEPDVELPSGDNVTGVWLRGESLPNGQPSNISVSAAPAAPGTARAPPSLLKLPFWAVFPNFTASMVSPLPPIGSIIKALLLPSLLVFIVLNIEHIVMARTFGHYHAYTVYQNSEMFATGLSNLAGAFFGGVPVGGGDIARSSLLAVTGAKSPLNQIFTSVTALVVSMPLSGALRFLPQAALSAIIVVAVIDQQPPQKLLGDYFRLSFADFLAFFTAFNIAIAVPSVGVTIGTAVGVGILVVYTMFRGMFSRPKVIKALDLESVYKERAVMPWMQGDQIPPGTQVIKLEADMVWTNADRIRRHVVDTCMVHSSSLDDDSIQKPEYSWNFRIHEHVAALRRKHNVMNDNSDLDSLIRHRHRLRVVVLDMTSTSFIDSSAILNLEMMKRQLREWAGEGVELRFVGMNARVLKRFERAKWEVVDPYEPRVSEDPEEYKIRDLKFDHLPAAIYFINDQTALGRMWEDVDFNLGQDIDKVEKA